ISKLLASKLHEERVVAVMILAKRLNKADLSGKKEIYDFYFENISGINNWDLVDSSAPIIVGGYLYLSGETREVLYKLVKSNNLWKKRIAMMATFYFIKERDFSDALKIAEILVNDSHDLIHKAVGWMLREVGNRDIGTEEKFLEKYYKQMPRTMLRYAIEKFPEEKRQKCLKGKI
ncbi:DNA alkylation repair protein, partial [Candidatus Shapirobacteria bacterium CG_4_8_14_3_um_filter_39_11]